MDEVLHSLHCAKQIIKAHFLMGSELHAGYRLRQKGSCNLPYIKLSISQIKSIGAEDLQKLQCCAEHAKFAVLCGTCSCSGVSEDELHNMGKVPNPLTTYRQATSNQHAVPPTYSFLKQVVTKAQFIRLVLVEMP